MVRSSAPCPGEVKVAREALRVITSQTSMTSTDASRHISQCRRCVTAGPARWR